MAPGESSPYLALLKELLIAQDARKTSLEQRGIAVITSSGTLASLLLAFAALVTASKSFSLSTSASALVVAATIAFVGAAIAAVVTNVPASYAGVSVMGLAALVRDKWGDEHATAEQRVAGTLVKLLASAKKRNQTKAWVLFWAMAFEVIAVILLAAAVVVILA